MLRDTWTVYTKELREVLRDRRTLIFMVLMPVLLMPVILQFTTSFMKDAEREATTKTLQYAVFGSEHVPALGEALQASEAFGAVDLEGPAEIEPALRRGDIDFALVLEPGPTGQTNAVLHYDNAPVLSSVSKRVGAVVERVGEQRRSEALAALGLSATEREAVLEPVVLVERGLASQRVFMGERLGGMLPYFFILFCFMGALYPAIDLGAGEKERGTLETLLLAPVSRTQLVLGKFLVVFTTGVVSAVLGAASLGVWVAQQVADAGGDLGGVLGEIGVFDVALMAVLLVPVAAVLAAALLSISIYAKSFKEAQSYMTPLNILIIVPPFLAMLPGVTLDWRWAMIPICNVALGIKEVVKGTLDPTMLVLILVSSTAVAAAMLVFCIRWFSRESVLFRM